MSWIEQAACRRAPVNKLPWIEEAPLAAEVVAMLSVCGACPVLAECRSDAVDYDDRVGVRGGVNWTQRGPRTGRPRRCAWCSTTFTPAGLERCCSPGCERKRAELSRVVCARCGSPVPAGSKAKFCSRECRSAAARLWSSDKPRRTRPAPKPALVAAAIGAESQRRAARLRQRAAEATSDERERL